MMNQSRVKALLLASRPKTLWAGVAPVIIGTAMAAGSGAFHLISALATLIGAVLIQVGTNFANDYFDFKKGADDDDRLGPTRATQAGLLSPSAMKRATFAVFALAVLVGLYLVWRGGLPILVIGLASVLFGVLYTATRYAIGYLGLGDIFVLIFFGPVAVGGTYWVQALDISRAVIIAGIAPGLFSVAILTVNNLRDVQTDLSAGKKTLAVRFGVTFARVEYLATVVIACLVPVIMLLSGDGRIYSALTVLVLLAAISPVRQVFTASGTVLNDVLASTGRLLLLYSVIFSIGWFI